MKIKWPRVKAKSDSLVAWARGEKYQYGLVRPVRFTKESARKMWAKFAEQFKALSEARGSQAMHRARRSA